MTALDLSTIHPILRPRAERIARRPKNRRALKALLAEAAAVHAQYDQYADHWNRWTRVVVTQDIRTKLGLAFKAGDIALAEPDDSDLWWVSPMGQSRMVYSWRNEIDTAVPTYAVRPYPTT